MPRDLGSLTPETEQRAYFQLFKVQLADGIILRYTDADLDVSQDVGDGTGIQTWAAAPGIRRGPLRAGIGLEIDAVEFTVPNIELTLGSLTRRIATWGRLMRFHGAEVSVYIYDEEQALSALHSTWILQSMQRATLDEVTFTLESVLARLAIEIPRTRFQPQCNNALFDAICAVIKSSFEHIETVTSATIDSIVFGNSQSRADGYFDLGVVEFTSGPLSGMLAKVAVHAGTMLTLYTTLPEAPGAGVTFKLWPGCHKDIPDCRDKFGNVRTVYPDWRKHFRGFPYVPTWEELVG